MINGKKIGLVLSGGGAKGFAHIGVLKALEKNGIIPDIIVGTSMGSVIGGLYAGGMSLLEMEEKCLKLKASDLFDLNMFNITKQGIIAGKKFEKLIEKNTKVNLIENFPIKYACVAFDVRTAKEYIFDSGKFSIATRTSSSIPGIFAPLKKDGMLLVDGGVTNNIPTNVAYDMGADYVISVDCIGEKYLIKDLKSIIDIILSSFSALQYLLNKYRGYRSNVKIIINNENSYLIAKKEITRQNIALGEIVAKDYIQTIKNDLNMTN